MSAGSQVPFDVRSFRELVNRNGRAYRSQAMKLISICRNISTTSPQLHGQDVALQRVLRVCDYAITRANESRKRTTQEADDQFDRAIRNLRDYISDPSHQLGMIDSINIADLMVAAKQTDTRNKNLNIVSLFPNKRDSLRVVSFCILNTLPDPNPTVVKQALCDSCAIPEILWYSSHFPNERRLFLARNPHFYADLPTHPAGYGGEFRSLPTETYQDTVYVLTNNVRRVFLECGPEPRIFDNLWKVNGILIFKNVAGSLEGEIIVDQSITNLPIVWSKMEHSASQLTVVEHITDWRVPILNLWNASHTCVHMRSLDLYLTLMMAENV